MRTMYRAGKTAQVCKEISRYKVEILGISECRLRQNLGRLGNRQRPEIIIFAARNDRGTQRNIPVKYLLPVRMEGCLNFSKFFEAMLIVIIITTVE